MTKEEAEILFSLECTQAHLRGVQRHIDEAEDTIPHSKLKILRKNCMYLSKEYIELLYKASKIKAITFQVHIGGVETAPIFKKGYLEEEC
jgi:hypothetical protein